MMEKTCNKCGETKPIKYGFYRNPSSGYVDGYCRECKNEQSRKRHKERYWTDEEYRERQRATHRKGAGTK